MSLCRAFVISFFVVLFFGCSAWDWPPHSTEAPLAKTSLLVKNPKYVLYQGEEVRIESFSQQSVVDSEDTQIIRALVALDVGDIQDSISAFNELWKSTKNPKYLKQALGIQLEASRFSAMDSYHVRGILEDIKKYLEIDPHAQDVRRALVALLVAIKDGAQAKIEIQSLLKAEQSEENYELAASVSLVNGEVQEAISALKKAYSMQQSALILERLAALLSPKESVTLLETHIRFKGCEEKTCQILAEIYKKTKNFKNLENVYTKLYQQNPSKENLDILLNVMLFNKNYARAMSVLEENPSHNKPLLLDLYLEQEEKTKALSLSQELYQETKESRYLLVEAMIEYENLKQPISTKSLLDPIIQKLEKIIALGDGNDLVYNFLGYLLIDHRVDIKQGISWIEKALEQKPDVPAYLDSLGWGYYQLNECARAMEIFKKIPDEEKNKEPEIKSHYQQVQRCLSKGAR